MNEELISQIEDLGLSEKEAKVYVANLMLGPAAVQKIADQSGIKRVTTYVILESLSGLGLVSQSNQGKKTLFTAEDPISLRRLLDKKQQQLKEQKSAFEGMLPDLESLKGLPTDSPTVKFYDSAEGIRSIVNSFIAANRKDGEVVYGISNLDQLYAFFPEIESEKANPSRLDAGVHSKIIYTTTRGAIFKQEDSIKNRESKFVQPEKYPLNGDLTIFGDNVVLLSLSGPKPVGVTIQSVQIAQTLLTLFQLCWDSIQA